MHWLSKTFGKSKGSQQIPLGTDPSHQIRYGHQGTCKVGTTALLNKDVILWENKVIEVVLH